MFIPAYHPILANALEFAFNQATTEGKITVGVLALVSLFSWSVIISKTFQFTNAAKASRDFFRAFQSVRDPMELFRQNRKFDHAPAFSLYAAAMEEINQRLIDSPSAEKGKISEADFDLIKMSIEEAAIDEAQKLEKGMIVLSTAVAGGPFIGLLGTVWGVMDTFAGIARANSASLTAMAPGVAGALVATVIGLLVAIPAMFAYNFMVTRLRMFTQELDGFALRLATQIEHQYVLREKQK